MKKLICPHCGKELNEMGMCREYLSTFDKDGDDNFLDYGDILYYFCPECGKKLPGKMVLEFSERHCL